MIFHSTSAITGLVLCFSFVTGCALAVTLLRHRKWLTFLIAKAKRYFVLGGGEENLSIGCDVCGASKCNRHGKAPNREPWRGLFVDPELDSAVDSVSRSRMNKYCPKPA